MDGLEKYLPTLDQVIDLNKAIAIDNAGTASAAYVTNSKVEAVLSKLKDGNSAAYILCLFMMLMDLFPGI